MSFGNAAIDRDVLRNQVIDASVAGARRSVGWAYLLWFGLGGIGAHNFYLGKPLLGGLQVFFCLMLILGSVGGVLALLAIPVIFVQLAILIVDAFLIPARARAYGERQRARITAETEWRGA